MDSSTGITDIEQLPKSVAPGAAAEPTHNPSRATNGGNDRRRRLLLVLAGIVFAVLAIGCGIIGVIFAVKTAPEDEPEMFVSIFGEFYSSKTTTQIEHRWTGNTNTIPTYISAMTNLEYLGLIGRRNGSIPTQLGLLTKLTILKLENTELTGTLPSELGAISALTFLLVSSNELSGTIPTELGKLTGLTGLGLARNNLTGTIPEELFMFEALQSLGLPYNSLVGTIPTLIGSLSRLTFLALADNSLTGTIPTQLGLLKLLWSLQLQDNQLTGSIPSELIASWLGPFQPYLSGNHISGTFPDLN